MTGRKREKREKIYSKNGNLTTQTIIDKCCHIFGLDNNDDRYALSVNLVTSTGRSKLVPVDLLSSLEDGDECDLIHLSKPAAKKRHKANAEALWSLDLDETAFISTSYDDDDDDDGNDRQQQSTSVSSLSPSASSVSSSSASKAGMKNHRPASSRSSSDSTAPAAKSKAAAAEATATCTSKAKSKNTRSTKPTGTKKTIDKYTGILVAHPVGTLLAVEMAPGYFYEATLVHYYYMQKEYDRVPPNYDPNKKTVKLYSKLDFKTAVNERGQRRSERLDLRCYRHFVVRDDGVMDGDNDAIPDFVMIPKTIDMTGMGCSVDTSVQMILKECSNSKRKQSNTRDSSPMLPQVGDKVSVKWDSHRFNGCVARTRWVKDYETIDIGDSDDDDDDDDDNHGGAIGKTSRFFALVEYGETNDHCWSLYDGPGSRQARHTLPGNRSLAQTTRNPSSVPTIHDHQNKQSSQGDEQLLLNVDDGVAPPKNEIQRRLSGFSICTVDDDLLEKKVRSWCRP
jgi:hypothetical protein